MVVFCNGLVLFLVGADYSELDESLSIVKPDVISR